MGGFISSYYGLLLICTILAFNAVYGSSATVDFGGVFTAESGMLLGGDEGEMLTMGSEFEMESEVSRRILATTRYISYGALRRNTVPCSRRGASYYNCRPGAQANPYTRGCSAITRCRS